jgi:hypothetical protein
MKTENKKDQVQEAAPATEPEKIADVDLECDCESCCRPAKPRLVFEKSTGHRWYYQTPSRKNGHY